MKSFHWDKHFVTGLIEIDRQHHHLVDIINQFGYLLAENKLAFDDIEAIFGELTHYAKYHFKEEEVLMSQVGVDHRHLDHHIQIHHDFIQEVASMQADISPDHFHTIKHLLDFLTHWLAYHILGSDQNMARQIEAIQSGVSPSKAYDAEERMDNNATEPLLISLNALFQKVSARNKELVQLNQSLEEKVEERTKALSQANLHLKELALTDILTGLPNRRHAMRRLADIWDESTKTNTPLTCMMIDADQFKEVNDTYGHDAGDAVLHKLAETLQHTLRTDDVLCRLGGDEFFVICPNTNREGGMHIAELTRKTISELRVPTGDGYWHGSISIGVAIRTPGIKNHEELIKMADKGVYAAKKDGKNCVKTTFVD
ncbi:MAG: diguanylate cyclase [Candidatus Thiodiazotropha sp. (ex Epidulcina cf. delphinae)]|nr:diguanylate cyclase [Candidatus Thiodiazotropha sp. (ex Epidulcina cf. delphinae)]MCU7928252.1 diguanylate cyclase [Candidatus Thiodiazotropha sp. (ex Dulcina madagascariensis)]